MAESFPLYLPAEARRLFQTESLLRRFAQMAHWHPGSRLLELHGSLGGLALARALNCTLTVIEPEQRIAEGLKERARLAGLLDKVTFLNQPVASLTFPEQSFDGIFSLGRVVGPLAQSAQALRPLLAPKGRIGLTWLVRVSRHPSQASLDAWQKRLGLGLELPRENLMALEREGYEPELIESVGDTELDDYYREVEISMLKAPESPGVLALREEIAVHKAQAGKSGVTWAFVVARRKEPGEKPPVSRDGG
jgi:hypothetical protein